MISISLFIGRRDRKRMIGTVNHIIVRIEDDVNFVLGLCVNMSLKYSYGHDRPKKT